MKCEKFGRLVYLLQADELSEIERRACLDHLDACPACSARLAAEEELLRVLRAKLSPTPAPPGLETRVRAALRREFPTPAALPWYRAPWLAAAAAALLLVAILVPGLRGGLEVAGDGTFVHVTRLVTVVDRECDRAGMPIGRQRKCSHPLHVNALKLADGQYWAIDADREEHRALLLDAERRGRRLEIDGDYFPGLRTVRLRYVRAVPAEDL